MNTATLPGYPVPEGAIPQLDIEALRRAAAPDDMTPVVVTRAYLKVAYNEIVAGRIARGQVMRAAAIDGLIESIEATVQ